MSGRFLRLFHQQRLELYAAQRRVDGRHELRKVSDERGGLPLRVVLPEGNEVIVLPVEERGEIRRARAQAVVRRPVS